MTIDFYDGQLLGLFGEQSLEPGILVGQGLLALAAGLGLLLLASPAIELGSMEAELFGGFADADSLGQSQRLVLVSLGVTGAGLLSGLLILPWFTSCSVSLNGVSTGKGQDHALTIRV